MRRIRLSTVAATGVFVVGAVIFSAADTFPQSPQDKQGKGRQGKGDEQSPFEVETARLAKLVEKSERPPETERDRFLKELSKLPAPTSVHPNATEFEVWFQQLSGGRPAWERAASPRKNVAELFDRVAARLEIADGRVARAQFLAYANEFLREGSSAVWKYRKPIDLAEEADDTLKKLDRDRDGRLTGDEVPETLRTSLRTWDYNGDGGVDKNEFRAYFPNRLQTYYNQTTMARRVAERPDDRAHVYRAGHLPKGLPGWFVPLDNDQDGQVGLYEWRLSGWSSEGFQRLDRNDDGLLEPLELVKQLQLTDRDGSRPNAELAQLKLDSGAMRRIEAGMMAEPKSGKKGKGSKGR